MQSIAITWRHKDIAIAYSLRWLVEVFIADWKGHLGWMSKQQGDEGALRGMTLSLLCYHLLLLHSEQSARLRCQPRKRGTSEAGSPW